MNKTKHWFRVAALAAILSGAQLTHMAAQEADPGAPAVLNQPPPGARTSVTVAAMVVVVTATMLLRRQAHANR